MRTQFGEEGAARQRCVRDRNSLRAGIAQEAHALE
jgi:hypothetical protein